MKEHDIHNEEFELPEALKELQGKNPFSVPDGYFKSQQAILNGIATPKVAMAASGSSLFSLTKLAIAASIALVVTVSVLLIIPSSTEDVQQAGEDVDTLKTEMPVQEQIPASPSITQHTPSSPSFDSPKVDEEVIPENEYTKQGSERHEDQQIALEQRTRQGTNDKHPTNGMQEDRGVEENGLNKQTFVQSPMSSGHAIASNDPKVSTSSATSSAASTSSGEESDLDELGLSLGEDIVSLDPVRLTARCALQKKPYYIWSTGDTTSSVYIQKSGRYWVKVSKSKDMRKFDVDTLDVTIVPRPRQILGEDIEICSGQDLELKAKSTHKNYTYSWDRGEYTGESIKLGTLPVGTHEVLLSISACGEIFEDAIVIHVKNCAIDIPNVITPNNDGSNDYFVIGGLESYPGSELLIQDRNGKQVYHSKDYQNNWNADGLEDGTYFYLLIVNDGQHKESVGIITVMRK